jgi:hypothetical protein
MQLPLRYSWGRNECIDTGHEVALNGKPYRVVDYDAAKGVVRLNRGRRPTSSQCVGCIKSVCAKSS